MWICANRNAGFCSARFMCIFGAFVSLWRSTGCNEPSTKNKTYVDIKRMFLFQFSRLFSMPSIQKLQIERIFCCFFYFNFCSCPSFPKLYISIFFLFSALLFCVIWKLRINDVSLTTEQKIVFRTLQMDITFFTFSFPFPLSFSLAHLNIFPDYFDPLKKKAE